MSEVVTVERVVDECRDVKTIEFGWNAKARPGQFVMVWIPGVDEVPMSLSVMDGGRKGITVKAIGEATEALHRLGPGDRLRVRGPYGNGFDTGCGRILAVGGGVGTAAVLPAVVETSCDLIIAGRTSGDVMMESRAEPFAGNVWIATDDGSRGFHGNAVQLMRERLADGGYDSVIACGPEVMLYHTYRACEELGVGCQLSLERYMKCGAGVCGCCVMDGLRVCADGPVFGSDRLAAMAEFNESKRDECGRLVCFR